MSVIRQLGVLGQITQQRLLGITAGAVVAVFDVFTVGFWFVLAAGPSRTTAGALLGLGLLLGGSLARIAVYTAAIGDNPAGSVIHPQPVSLATFRAGCWLSWLILADRLGGLLGVLFAGVVLAGTLTASLSLEQWVVDRSIDETTIRRGAIAAGVASVGGTILLGVTWFGNWVLLRVPLVLGWWTPTLEFGTTTLAFCLFITCIVAGQQYRFQRLYAY